MRRWLMVLMSRARSLSPVLLSFLVAALFTSGCVVPLPPRIEATRFLGKGYHVNRVYARWFVVLGAEGLTIWGWWPYAMEEREYFSRTELRYRAPGEGRSHYITKLEKKHGGVIVAPQMVAPDGGAIAFVKWRQDTEENPEGMDTCKVRESVCVWQPGWSRYRVVDSVDLSRFPTWIAGVVGKPRVLRFHKWSDDGQSFLYEKWLLNRDCTSDYWKVWLARDPFSGWLGMLLWRQVVEANRRRFMNCQLWRWTRGPEGGKERVLNTVDLEDSPNAAGSGAREREAP